MAEKPANLIYGANDKPPLFTTILLGFQHYWIISIAFVFPVLVIREINGTIAQAEFLLSMSMFAGGIGTIMQSLKKGQIGSGYLCPQVCSPSYMAASMAAASAGGLPLLFGMTLFAGTVEAFISRIVKKIRFLFPPEVTGLIVFMVGVSVIGLAAKNFLSIESEHVIPHETEIFVAILTLGTMVSLNIWSKGKMKLYSVLIGITVGYIASYFTGILNEEHFSKLAQEPIFDIPFDDHPGWDFDLSFVLTFFIATICSSVKSIGDLLTCQKINDKNWKKPDMENVSKGILADSFGPLSAGLLGGMGQSTSSSNVGLSVSTSATSRYIGFSIGALLIVLAFFPKFSGFFAIMPRPVIGATIYFAVSFMLIAGIQIIMSRLLDNRKIFVVGLSIIMGISVDIFKVFFHQNAHPLLAPVLSNSLTAATFTAIILNLLFRIGIKRKASMKYDPVNDDHSEIFDFMEQHGAKWAARKDVVKKAGYIILEYTEALNEENKVIDNQIDIHVTYDDLNMIIDIEYKGDLIKISQEPPKITDYEMDEHDFDQLAGYMPKTLADKIEMNKKNGIAKIRFYFEM